MLDFLEELESKRRFSFSEDEMYVSKIEESPEKLFFKNEISSSENEDSEDDMEETFSEIYPMIDENLDSKKNKIKKRKRGNKKDDFDYNKYIQQELKKSNSGNLDNSTKKKLIQKIRNRMSAQRSRLRQKELLKKLEEENKILKSQNREFEQKIKKLEKDNEYLSHKKSEKRPTKNSLCTADDNDTKDPILSSPEYFRAETPTKDYFNKQFLFICFFVGIMLFCNNFSNDTGVKMGGIIPKSYSFENSAIPKTDFISNFVKNHKSDFIQAKKRFQQKLQKDVSKKKLTSFKDSKIKKDKLPKNQNPQKMDYDEEIQKSIRVNKITLKEI
jgi:hypothetical protein